MVVRLLCTGDIHIGRRCSGTEPPVRTASAWDAVIDLALREQVDVLAVSGDVIDKEIKAYEALGPLQRGLDRLDMSGIETVAVSGNHDHDVLHHHSGARRFHLIGRGGNWERRTLTRNGRPLLHVDGWSFPKEHVHDTPMRDYPARPDDGVPVLGLLHGDLDNPRSPYAPIAAQQLWAQPITFWLLGHLHLPQVIAGPGSVALYPGSPFAMDAGEPGMHGAWRVDLVPGQRPEPKPISLSPVRYMRHEVDVTGVEDQEGFTRSLANAVADVGRIANAADTDRALRTVICRLAVTGHTPAYAAMPAWAENAHEGLGTIYAERDVRIVVERVSVDIRPPIDLSVLSGGTGPLSETARLLLALEREAPEPPYAQLVHDTERSMRAVAEISAYTSVASRDPDGTGAEPEPSDARTLLRREGWRLLMALMAQKEQA